MNVDSIINKIKLFDELVIDSGFKRNIPDYINSIHQNPTIVFMEGISERIQESFTTFTNNSLDSELTDVLTKKAAFTSTGIAEQLQKLGEDKTIEAQTYFQKLNEILANLNSYIHENETEINEIREIFERYTSDKITSEAEEGKALLSIIFKDAKTIRELKELSKVLNRWNYTLQKFHELVTSVPPEETSIAQIQSGSIDVIIKIDIKIAFDFTKLVKEALATYRSYLEFKSSRKDIAKTFSANSKLIEVEREMEEIMFESIRQEIEHRIKRIHQERLKDDQNITREAIDGKIKAISATIIDHLVKDNEIKLLNAPQNKDKQDGEEDVSKELRDEMATVRGLLKKLSREDRILLLEKYSLKNGEDQNGEDQNGEDLT